MRRRTIGAVAAITVVAIGAGVILVGGPLSTPTQAQGSAPPSANGTVARQTLNATTQVDGTLGYPETYSIANAMATAGGSDPAALTQAYAAAQAQYDAALAVRDALDHPKATDVANAEASLAQVAASLQAAEQAAAGATPRDIDQAKAQLASAQSQLAAAQQAAAGATPAQLASAQAQLAQAQAQLLSAQQAAAGPAPARLAAAQAAVTEASGALATDQAALNAAQAALAAGCPAGPTPDPDATPEPTPTPAGTTCDLSALQLAVQQAQARVTTDQAQLTSAQAALSDLTSADAQAEAQANLASAQAGVNAAQAALDALTSTGSRALSQQNLASAQAAATAAQSALDAVLHGNPAQAKAQLTAARAQVSAARASLYALRHPTTAQRTAAQDAVASAAAQLAAAKGSLAAPRGVVTDLAAVGSIVQPGEVLYALDGTHPVVLLAGEVPAWRALGPGVSDGPDVQQLESNLKALGYGAAALTVDRHWDAGTTSAVRAWQHALGLTETGTIPLGEVVFEPGPMRITAASATLGSTIQPGGAVLRATSTTVAVTIALDPGLQTKVKVGDPVSVTMPDGSTAPGKVSDVGTVATTPSGGDPNSTASPTIEVTVTLDDPSATGGLDQAPVTVNITTATATDVLAVPVSALVELLGGGYAVQVEDGGQLHYVAVQLGLFANGMVEVSGQGLAEGQHIVVAQ